MSEIELKLARYRAQKRRKELIDKCKTKIVNMLPKFGEVKRDSVCIETEQACGEEAALLAEESDINSDLDETTDFESEQELSKFDYLRYCLIFFVWAGWYAVFIQLQFGTVYLILSGIIGMYWNTRTGPKKRNEPSAYSVFNRNCESIDGTLNAEQLTNQMLYGGLVR